jgi:hypothetical protein
MQGGALQSLDNRPAVGGRHAVPAFLLAPTRVEQALPTARLQPLAAQRGTKDTEPKPKNWPKLPKSWML